MLLAPGVAAQAAPRPRPRLVVVIAVDQLRADYIERFRPYFGAGGFNLFLQRGASFAQARYAHATTSTCPGHAVILTGSYGEVNGIIANEWYDTRTGRPTYCAEDAAVTLVGSPGPGRSPRKLFGATVGDVLRTATAGASRVVTVAAKDRSAIMLGGQLADAAYWIVDTLFVTSTYYRADLPAWVRGFNASGAMSRYFGRTWERLLPAAAYQMMGPDDEPAERDVAGMGRTFPHPLARDRRAPQLAVSERRHGRLRHARGGRRGTGPGHRARSARPQLFRERLCRDTPSGRRATRSWTPPSGWTERSSGSSAFSTARSAWPTWSWC